MKKQKTIKTERLTREMVRNIKSGESVVFVLPAYSSVASARQTVHQVEKLDKVDLTCSETGENIITITRHE
jgi:hypothetical protein